MNAIPWKLASDPSARYRAVIFGKIAQVSTSGSGRYAPAWPDYVDLFYSCLNKWKSETYFLSSVDDMLDHRSMRTIIEMGLPVVPLLIHELKKEPSPLVFALDDIVGASPYGREDAGDIKAMSDAWLAWGEREGW